MQRLDLPDVRIHGRQRLRMLQLDPPDLVADICQRPGDPPGNQARGQHRHHQRPQGNQQDRHDLIPYGPEQICLPDAHHGIKLPPARRNAAEQPAAARFGKPGRKSGVPLQGKEGLPLLCRRKDLFSLPVKKEHAFPEAGPVCHHGGQDPADPLPDLNIPAAGAEVVIVLHYQGNEFLAVGVRHIFGKLFISA